MPSRLLDYQKAVEVIVEEVMNELMLYRNTFPLVPCWNKPDLSCVTPADYAIQFFLRKKLTLSFPHISFVGEEVLYPQEDQYKIPRILEFIHRLSPEVTEAELFYVLRPCERDAELFWLVDPIDGTSGFIKNRSFAIAVALMYNAQPVLSVVGCPYTRETFKIYSASKGSGLFAFGSGIGAKKAIRSGLTPTGKFCEASLAARNQQHNATRQLSLSLPSQPQAHRVDSQYKYAMVAEGAADFFIRYPFIISDARIWDHAPGAFLVEEAGGRVSDLLGNPLSYDIDNMILNNHPVILASGNSHIHETTLEALRKHFSLNTLDFETLPKKHRKMAELNHSKI
ncbi:inositol monophosphatase family protein [Chlamydia ibidis]|uniref:Inositol monophosphatase family protein n=2 Tax=Chlamydia ibidis TaxID=1405396 RepID=S7J430_9CHLA|nr:inositol monophosphatase family protein [Chlamydia ibidis]EPP34747.1 inositol monophosphatase family protein [Chlamydia ibidis]EQM62450.1 inositol monophosphatase family protein [Chlamydia ibidis 10-1398/6]